MCYEYAGPKSYLGFRDLLGVGFLFWSYSSKAGKVEGLTHTGEPYGSAYYRLAFTLTILSVKTRHIDLIGSSGHINE